MITIFCVRPRGSNVGNEAISLGLRHLLREAFGGLVNLVQVPAADGGDAAFTGLRPRTIHEINLYGHGVVVGGGNLYENGQLDVDVHALRALRTPMMLFGLSHGRIYDNRHQLVPRTDSMPDATIAALHEKAAISVARDDATLEYLRSLGLTSAVLGGCPSMLVRHLTLPVDVKAPSDGCLLSIRHPALMSIPLRDQTRLHATIVDLIGALQADGFGPVRLLCHDTRDVAFASSLGDVEYILADDVYSHLAILRTAPLVVSFRLHAFLPCVSFGTPAVNISYDERSISLVRTIGLGEWDVDFIRSGDVIADVRDRCSRLADLTAMRCAAQPRWRELETTMSHQIGAFANLVRSYAAEGPL